MQTCRLRWRIGQRVRRYNQVCRKLQMATSNLMARSLSIRELLVEGFRDKIVLLESKPSALQDAGTS